MCDNSSRSFPANLASSATGLLRDTLSSNGNQVGATLSEALHDGSKAGLNTGVAASASSQAYQPTSRPEFGVATGVTSENDTFRSGIRPPNAPREAFEGITIDQFLQSDPPSQGPLLEREQQLGKGKKAIYTPHNGDVSRHSQNTDFVSAWQFGDLEKDSRGHKIDSLNDGNEVVKLLSNPSFQPEIWKEDDTEEPYTITKEEMQISQWFTKEAQRGESQRDQIQEAMAAARNGRAFQDFASIFDEIESYHEDVWGYIGPLVEAARQELHVTEPMATGDGPAVRRLRMIVAHLQSPALSNFAITPSQG
jgi:hypothetical protein